MTKLDLKEIVEYIQKQAIAPPAPTEGHIPVSAPPTPSHTLPTTPSKSAPTPGFRHFDIRTMQQALMGLAQAVTSQLRLQDLAGQDPKKQEAAARDSFGDFFTKHYLRNSDVSSVEFTPDPTKTQMAEKDPRTPSKLSWVMDTMRRIGGEKAEDFADGNWGPRTNAALQNSYAMAEGLLNLAKDFHVQVHSYTTADLAKLKPAIHPGNDLSPTEKIEVAPLVAGHLKAIRNMYEEIKRSILEKPQWRAYIEGDKPYIHYTGPTLTPQQLQAIQQTFPRGFNVPVDDKGTIDKIGVEDLASLDSIKKWISLFPGSNLNPSTVLAHVQEQVSREVS